MFAVITGLTTCGSDPRGPSDEWVRYQEALSQIDDLTAVEPKNYQLDWGGLTVVFDPLVRGSDRGIVFTEKNGLVFTEHWFWSGAALAPGAPFGFRFECDECAFDDPVALVGATWETDPYYRMDITYLDKLPPSSITNQLVLQNGEIDRYTFAVQQDGVITAELLREVHHPVGQEFTVDHWAFRAGYAPPSAEQPEVQVAVGAVQFATTAQFFQAIKNTGVTQYAKVTYDEGVGGDY